MPHLTIEGRDVVGTSVGFFATVLVAIVMLVFGAL
jgi:hypothetical protein